MPSRNPLPLSASQEAQVRDIFYDRVRQQCAEEIKGMSGPTRPSSIWSAPWPPREGGRANTLFLSLLFLLHQHSQPAPSAARFPFRLCAATRIAS